MGKIRNKNHDETRHYKGIIRDLQKQVRQLQKQLKYYSKREHILEDNQEEIKEIIAKKEEQVQTPKRIKCSECNQGYYDELSLLNKLYGTCDNCGHRKRLV